MEQIQTIYLGGMNNAAHFLFVSNVAQRAQKDEAVAEKCAAQVDALKKAVAAEVLSQHIKDYKINPQSQLDAETGLLVNFIQDLEGKFKAQVKKLGLSVFVEQLKAANESVRELTAQRTDERSAKTAGALKAARTASDEAYKELAKPQNAVAGNYDIGDKGPGGGWIFYVSEEGFPVYKGNSMVTCHYLECSPTSLGTAKWCSHHGSTCNIEYRDGVGAGLENTIKILLKHSGISASQCAAKLCNLYYTDTTKQGTWYLPSGNELVLILDNLVKKGFVAFNGSYWSSVLNDYKRPCYYYYNPDNHDSWSAATECKREHYVIAVRAF